MIRLTNALTAWGTPEFEDILRTEVEQIDPRELPLQQGLSTSSHVTDSKHTVMILSVSEEAGVVRARAGIFYSGIIAGCSCADDPTPLDEHNEYCEVQLEINTTTAETTVALLSG